MPYKDPDRRKEYLREYKDKYRARMRELNKQSYERHKKEILARRQVAKALQDVDTRHRKERAYSAIYRKKHRKELRKRARERYRTDMKCHLYYRNYHAKKKGSTIGPINIQALVERDSVCAICHKHIPARQRSIDHILPISKGGAHIQDNLRIVHIRCNLARNNRGAAQLRLFA